MTPIEFSIVIPTYNRPKQLARCLASLARLDYPRERFEVIVVDDCSPTDLSPIVAGADSSLNLRLIRQNTNGGPAKARNAGAADARRPFIAFTDDDCAPSPDWLTRFADRLSERPDVMVGGHSVNVLHGNIYSAASQALIDYIYGHFNRDPERSTFFASNNMAMSLAQFRQIGGFDPALPRAAGEDRDLCDRWLFAGFGMVYEPRVKLLHFHALSIKKFWKQHFTYGRGAFTYHTLRAKRVQSGIQIERFAFYRDLIRHAFKHEQGTRAGQLAALLTLSQAANALGFFWEAGLGGVKMIRH